LTNPIDKLGFLGFTFTKLAINLFDFKVMLGLKDQDMLLEFTGTLLQRFNDRSEVFDLMVFIIFDSMKFLLESDNLLFKRLLRLVRVVFGSPTALDSPYHLLMLPVGFLELPLRVSKLHLQELDFLFTKSSLLDHFMLSRLENLSLLSVSVNSGLYLKVQGLYLVFL